LCFDVFFFLGQKQANKKATFFAFNKQTHTKQQGEVFFPNSPQRGVKDDQKEQRKEKKTTRGYQDIPNDEQ
jgi:hypothetical protein